MSKLEAHPSVSSPEPANGADGLGVPESEERGLAELMAVRRAKAHLLLPPGESAFPYSFPDTEPIAEVRAGFRAPFPR